MLRRGGYVKEIVQDYPNQFKHLLNKIHDLVIVVGAVDTVDGSPKPLYLG